MHSWKLNINSKNHLRTSEVQFNVRCEKNRIVTLKIENYYIELERQILIYVYRENSQNKWFGKQLCGIENFIYWLIVSEHRILLYFFFYSVLEELYGWFCKRENLH